MTLEDIFKIEGTIITTEKLNEIMQSEFIAFFQNCGASGLKIGYTWYILNLIDGTEVNFYCKNE
ncbi:MAG: hypothetical protein Q7K48_04085 [Fusobacterium sp. JB021]|nr:hypothetical protein [Fusobacterium sp. JB020]MDP0493455.1 hypothetical protein [Fusobacterium sp. JB021]MDP0507088.1 hypothetical protein [Fusobacterium sp. JB019]